MALMVKEREVKIRKRKRIMKESSSVLPTLGAFPSKYVRKIMIPTRIG